MCNIGRCPLIVNSKVFVGRACVASPKTEDLVSDKHLNVTNYIWLSDYIPQGQMITNNYLTLSLIYTYDMKVSISHYFNYLTNYAIIVAHHWPTLKRKCLHFDEIFITGCTESCQNDNFQCSQWWKFHQNDDIFVSVYMVATHKITARNSTGSNRA